MCSRYANFPQHVVQSCAVRSVNLTRAWKASVLLMEQILAAYSAERAQWEQRRSGSDEFVRLRRELRATRESLAAVAEQKASLVRQVGRLEAAEARNASPAPEVGELLAVKLKKAKGSGVDKNLKRLFHSDHVYHENKR